MPTPWYAVSVTRSQASEFDRGTLLGRSLSQMPLALRPQLQLRTENHGPAAMGLGEAYNAAIEALRAGAEPVKERMRAMAPRAPGAPDLADNIGVGVARVGEEAAIAIGPTKNFFYGLFQEEGTSRHGAQPFARPALDATQQEALGIVGATIWHELIRRGAVSTRSSGGGGGLL